MIRLLNSAMMPKEGKYVMKRIDKDNFCKILVEAYKNNELDSYIGYKENIELIKKWTNIEVQFNRNTTTINNGDKILVMKLKYRMDPSQKGKQAITEDDLKFFIVDYEEL